MDQTIYDSLTLRERECLRLARDMPTKEIARVTQLSPSTVDTYIRRATDKLGVNRRQAARLVADFEACPHALGSEFLRLPDLPSNDDQASTDRPLPSLRQPSAVREERVPFDFGIISNQQAPAAREPEQHGGPRTVPAAFWVMAIAVLIMLLIIGAVPMTDSMGKIGQLIYTHH